MRIPAALSVLSGLLLVSSALAAPTPKFPPSAVWNRDISQARLHPDSSQMLATLQGLGGWGNGDKLQIDFSLHVLHADASAPMLPIARWPGRDYYTPDCDPVGTQFPLPPGGAIEGQGDYSCDDEGDCHLLVVKGNTLYEAYAARQVGSSIQSMCAVVWHLDRVYPPEGRGEQCTSADAAGFPVAALLFNADDVKAAMATHGDLGHAIRFIMPNARIARREYVRPASHGTNTTGPAASIPYGVRMRLKSSFNLSGYNPAAQVILRTMQRYGIVLADGGNIGLTAQNDRFTTAKWADIGIGPHVFINTAPAVKVTDFEVINTGPRHAVTYDCERTAHDFRFIDGFEHW